MNPDRRLILQAGAASVVALFAQGCAMRAGSTALPSFTSVPAGDHDAIRLPPGYRHDVIYRWGDATGIDGGAAGQHAQAGMHHDGMHFFPLGHDGRRGLLVMNHEYTDESLLQLPAPGSALERTHRSQHAMGVSVIEVERHAQGWRQVLPSKFARRIHGQTPMRVSGPAAGTAALKTALDPSGLAALGTFANCAMGVTPWGTYLSCEENFNGYFGGPAGASFAPDAAQRRYGLAPGGQWVDWWQADERFDLTRHPNEANRFGWVVEIDPMDPASMPVKRTALGRKMQESATCTLTRDGRVAVYMGDDARFEFIYKFVSAARVQPGGYAANRDLLDKGTLYAARFDAQGRGAWLELPTDALVHARLAAQAAGATPMDRPEWIAVHPQTGEVYATLTNNTQRGEPGKPGVDAANPRAANTGGHVIRWREADSDAGATAFAWDHFVLAGDPLQPASGTRYPGQSADAFGSPDGLHFDSGGLLWIQTDMSGPAMGKGAYARLGNNAMLCANPVTGDIRRFLVGPRGCEITGCVLTPDRRTLFVNIQHPGETSDSGGGPWNSRWPDGGVPRSATVVVQREDGGIVGT